MNERDELADLIWDMAIRHLGVATSSSKSMADELIEAGYRKPRTITTAEELDVLAVDSVVRDDEIVWLRGNSEWYTPMTTAGYASMHINLPATVLWEPR